MATTIRRLGENERLARNVDLEHGSKRRAVLVALGGLLDERPDPSIGELARRCRRHRMEVVVVLGRLEDEGHVVVVRRGSGGDRPPSRTNYRINEKGITR